MSNREFLIDPDEDEWPFPWVVMSHMKHDSHEKPEFVEAWQNEEQAIHYGKMRHDQGYVVTVYKRIAFTIG